jgi:hypothetical protein
MSSDVNRQTGNAAPSSASRLSALIDFLSNSIGGFLDVLLAEKCIDTSLGSREIA